MNLSVYTHYFSPEIGAPSARVGDFSRNWLELGHDVHVVTCFPNHPAGVLYPGYRSKTYQHECVDGVNVHRSWSYITPNKGFLRKSLGHASFWLSAQLNSQRIPSSDCAIGTSPTFFAAMAARAKARRDGVPFVMEVRDLWPAIFTDLGVIRNRKIIRLLELWELNLYRTASRIVTVTEAFRANLISRGIAPHKVVTITNGADTEFWKPNAEGAEALRARLGLRGKFVVLYIGAHGISQRLGAILKAAERLKNTDDIRILFVGDGAEKEPLLAEAVRLGLHNVVFLASVDKPRVRDYYTMADACLVPLRDIPLFDTFIPSKMFEIMSVGCPIIGSVRGEAADILRSSNAAWVVAPEDSRAIADAIVNLKNEPEQAARMRENAHAFVAAHYSRRDLARRYMNVIIDARSEMELGGER